LRRCNPAVWLFSGWNWQAKRLSFCTDEAKAMP